MNLDKAEKLSESFPDWVSEGPLKREFETVATGALQTIKWFLNHLYANGYQIISKEELMKLYINVKHAT